MKLAVRKDEGSVPGGGFHYMMHPLELKGDMQPAFYEQIGYVIIEVGQEVGERLLKQATQALQHQLEVAHLTEAVLRGQK